MIILIVFLAALLLFILSIKFKSKGLGFISFGLLIILFACIFSSLEDKIYDFIDNCSLPLFMFLVVSSAIACLVLTLLERDAIFGISLLPTLLTGSILSDITIVYILNFIFSIDSDVLKILSIFLIPIIIIASAIILLIIFGTAIGFPLAVNFISKNRKSHSFLTLASSAVCSVLFIIAISHSGNFYLLADSLHIF